MANLTAGLSHQRSTLEACGVLKYRLCPTEALQLLACGHGLNEMCNRAYTHYLAFPSWTLDIKHVGDSKLNLIARPRQPPRPLSPLVSVEEPFMRVLLFLCTLCIWPLTLVSSATIQYPRGSGWNDFQPPVPIRLGKSFRKSITGPYQVSHSCSDAKSVSTTFRDSTEFIKGDDGVWTGYSRPLDVGFHYYELVIDGAHVPDPNSTFYFGAMRWAVGLRSLRQMPTSTRSKTFPMDRCAKSSFIRTATSSERRAFVYTPPGYDKDQSVRYPVLYLQHVG